MPSAVNWSATYRARQTTAAEAIGHIRSGRRVFVGTACGEPQHLVRELFLAARQFADLELVRLLTLENLPLTLVAEKTLSQCLTFRSLYLGSADREGLSRHLRFCTPINLSLIPDLFRSRRLPLDAALIQVAPPDAFGWLSLGVSVDITLAAALSADLVIAQVNPQMPRTLGNSFIHVKDVDWFVPHDEPLLAVSPRPAPPEAEAIAAHLRRLVPDGATLQVGLGRLHATLLAGLTDKHDLGIHTEVLTDAVMHLVSRGVVTNRRKVLNEGKLVASGAIGSRHLFDFLDDNPLIDLQPVDVVADPAVVRSHPCMVAINEASTIDLTGQVAADALPSSLYGGVSGMLDFHRGALRSPGGKAIVVLPSTDARKATSRILPRLEQTAAVIPRGDVEVVITEFGAVNLLGKSLQERATALISIAHPEHREALFHAAARMGLLGPERRLRDAIRGIYPIHLEEHLDLDGVDIAIRPARPSDDRRVQEHFYGLRRQDVNFRFFREKNSFSRSEMEPMIQIDYVRDLTLLAVIGEVGFEEVVGVGGYLLEGPSDRAEVAFSVSPAWQRKGIGKHLLRLLAQAGRAAGMTGFVAYTYPENSGMRKLFATLPHPVKTRIEDEMLVLTCRLDEAPAEA